jgi:hypothetical protein
MTGLPSIHIGRELGPHQERSELDLNTALDCTGDPSYASELRSMPGFFPAPEYQIDHDQASALLVAIGSQQFEEEVRNCRDSSTG